MRRLSLLGILLLLLLSACAGEEDPGLQPSEPDATPPAIEASDTPSADPAAPVAGDHRLGLTLPSGIELEYLLHAPPAVDRGRPLPLVLVFHGSPGSPEEMVRATKLDPIADTEGFLVAYPDSFVATEEVGALLDHLAELWPVDPRRVYATGFSRGATMTYVLADELAHRIAAFAPVSGARDGDFAPRAPASLITFQGSADDLAPSFPPVNRAWSQAAGCGPADTTAITFAGRPTRRSVADCRSGSEHVVYRVARMGHVWPRGASDLIWDFFHAHRLSR